MMIKSILTRTKGARIRATTMTTKSTEVSVTKKIIIMRIKGLK